MSVVNTHFGPKGTGWKPSLPDLRAFKHDFTGVQAAKSVDFRTETSYLPSVWDQSALGSCVMHGSPAALVFDLAKQGIVRNPDDFMPSRLFGYYEGRKLEGTVNEDSGLTITDGIKVLAKVGLPPESDWGYDINKFTQKPPQKAYDDAPGRHALVYGQVDNSVSEMQAALTSGLPIVIGFTVYSSFESDSANTTGVIPEPGSREQVLGGHCMLVVGYKEINGKPYWICRNSWGTEWGDNGYCYMPQDYLVNPQLAGDFWTVTTVSSPSPQPTPPDPDPTPTPTPDPSRPAYNDVFDAVEGALENVTGETATYVRGNRQWKDTIKAGGFELLLKDLHPSA